MRNEIQIAGPVTSPAVCAVTVKMTGSDHHRNPEDGQVPPAEILAQLATRLVGVRDGLLDRLGAPATGHAPGQYRVLCGNARGQHKGARCRHRGQHRGVVRRAGIVGFLRPSHGVRTRRAPEHTRQPRGGPPGPPCSPTDGPWRGRIRCAVPRSSRRHGGSRGAQAGEPAGLHLLRRRRSPAGHRAHSARRVHRLRAEPPAPGMADPASGRSISPTSRSNSARCANRASTPTPSR